MAIFTQKTIVILIFVEFLQVYISLARYTEFAHEPREHLDSGQVPAGEPFLPWTRKSFERDRPLWSYDSSEEDQNDNENDELIFETTESLQEENTNDNLLESYGVNENNRNVNNDNLYSYESSEDVEYFDVPLKRVRRRIIPVGGGGGHMRRTGRRRGGPSSNGKKIGMSGGPLQHSEKVAIVRRKGPTGSAALYSLFPELAPPDWRAKRGIKKKSRKNERNKGTSTITGEDKIQSKENKRILKTEEESAPQKRQKIAPVPKRKAKLSKQLKEEIAVFAEQHGIDKAVSHFSSRLNLPMRPEMVEKFLTRYQTRIQRRASRS